MLQLLHIDYKQWLLLLGEALALSTASPPLILLLYIYQTTSYNIHYQFVWPSHLPTLEVKRDNTKYDFITKYIDIINLIAYWLLMYNTEDIPMVLIKYQISHLKCICNVKN